MGSNTIAVTVQYFSKEISGIKMASFVLPSDLPSGLFLPGYYGEK